jgi:glycosyltransferase involved in cell wall biosynthesis
VAEEKPRRIVYLVPSLDNVCVRHRIDPFIPALEERGWYVEKWVIPRAFLSRLALFRRLLGADVVVVLRKLFSPFQTMLLGMCSRRVVFDFDDAVLYRDSSHRDHESPQRQRRFTRMMRAATCVIAGNEYLKSLAEERGGRATVVPTCVDDHRLTPGRKHHGGGKVVIGWVGSDSTLMYLRSMKPVFEEIGRRYGESVALKIVCDAFPKDLGIEVIEKKWSLADELEDLRSFDVGIMPMPDDAWTRGKCGLKLLQYMAVGVPAVASPVGIANDIILADGETGFLPKDRDEWVNVLSMMIESVEFRESVGILGRDSLRGRFTVADWTDRYVRAIEDAAQ